MPDYLNYLEDPPETGSKEHAIKSTLRNYHRDLEKITDAVDHKKTIEAMVQRIELCHRQTAPIDKVYSKQFQRNQTALEKLGERDPRIQSLARTQDSLEREWDRQLAPHYKSLHKDLDKIIATAVKPYLKRDRAFLKAADQVSKQLRSRALADQFKARQQTSQRSSKDIDRER